MKKNFMQMKRYALKLFVLLNILIISISSAGQYKKKSSFKRFFFGGDFWLSFGTNAYINVSPLAGYRITQNLSAGVGPIYIFEKNTFNYLDTTINNVGYYRSYKIRTSTYGGRVFLTYDLIRNLHQYIPIGLGNIIVHFENELLNLETFYLNPNNLRFYPSGNRIWIDNFLMGGGLRQPIGENASINLLILWDVTENKYSPHTNPIIRIGFTF
jgi:hypothetical protein